MLLAVGLGDAVENCACLGFALHKLTVTAERSSNSVGEGYSGHKARWWCWCHLHHQLLDMAAVRKLASWWGSLSWCNAEQDSTAAAAAQAAKARGITCTKASAFKSQGAGIPIYGKAAMLHLTLNCTTLHYITIQYTTQWHFFALCHMLRTSRSATEARQ